MGKITLRTVETTDISAWLNLSHEYDVYVNELVGNLTEWYDGNEKDMAFGEYMNGKIAKKEAVMAQDEEGKCLGIIAYSRGANRITFFGISGTADFEPVGNMLLKYALVQLDSVGTITVNVMKHDADIFRETRDLFTRYKFVHDSSTTENGVPVDCFCRSMKGRMNILIIYCHPSEDSFTYLAKEAFIKGITQAGHHYEISDLYKMHFNPVMSEQEYKREAFYNDTAEVPADVLTEQEKIERADSIVFIFPNFWTSAPALLEGWFQRVWTYGYAYGEHRMKIFEKAVFIMTMGGSLKTQDICNFDDSKLSEKDRMRIEQVESIKCCMIGDRMFQRAKNCEFYVCDEMTRGYGNDDNRSERIERFCGEICEMGINFES